MFHSHFKHAYINLYLKKSPLPANYLKCHRPISNLSYYSAFCLFT